MQPLPQFSVGDFVSQKDTMSKRVGMVIEVYDFEGQTRCVVRFEDGSESFFFVFELVAADEAADQASGPASE